MSLMRNLPLLGLRTLVILLLVAGRKRAALHRIEQMLTLQPLNLYALSSRVQLLAQLSMQPESIASARHLVSVFPDHAAGWFNLAYLLDADGQLQAAENAFQMACRLQPRLDRAWYGLGLVHIKQERWADAVEALTRNTALQPMSPFGWYQLARVHADQGEPEKARAIIQRLKDFEPKVAAQLERETGLPPAHPC